MTLDPRRALTAINELSSNLHELWIDYQTVEANLARAALSAPGGEGRSNGVANPTAGIAESHITYWDTVDNLTTALQYLRLAQRRMSVVQRDHAPIARHLEQVARNIRCDGGWDPTCVNNAVRNGRCWRCIKAEQRARSTEDVDMSTGRDTNSVGWNSAAR